MRVARDFVILLLAVSTLHAGAARGQALPEPPDIVARPAYLALVKVMREDEVLVARLLPQIASEKHNYKAECLASLRPGLVAPTIAWAIEPSLTAPEVAEAMRFFESEAGHKLLNRRLASAERPPPELSAAETLETSRFAKSTAGEKLLVKNITQEPRVGLSAKAELLDLLNICTETLDGTRQVTYCQSEWVPSADQACSARYEVTGPAGDTARSTRVSLYCKFPGSDLTSLLTELPGRHETIGLRWRENRSLEVLLPGAITPRYTQTAYPARGMKYEYRARRPGDPPAATCLPTPPVDDYGWPVG